MTYTLRVTNPGGTWQIGPCHDGKAAASREARERNAEADRGTVYETERCDGCDRCRKD